MVNSWEIFLAFPIVGEDNSLLVQVRIIQGSSIYSARSLIYDGLKILPTSHGDFMQLSTKYGFAFLCVPKCASSSIESAIRKFCNIQYNGSPHLKHINARDFNETVLAYHQRKIPEIKIESFCIMRDPTDWVFSWYKFRQRGELKQPSHPGHLNYTGNISFDEFVDAYTNTSNRPSYANIATQRNYFLLADGSIGVDHVFSMDKLNLVSEFLAEKIGRKIDIPFKNPSMRKKYSLDPLIEARLHSVLELDYSIFHQVDGAGKLSRNTHN
jgi:hypothetical protein